MLRTQEIDAYERANTAQFQQLIDMSGIRVFTTRSLTWEHVDLNCEDPTLSDARVRRALLPALLLLLLPCTPVPADGPPPVDDEVRLLANESVSRRFIPSRDDPEHDSLTGLSRQELIREATDHLAGMKREQPQRFARLYRMETGERAARSLYDQAVDLAARGETLDAISRPLISQEAYRLYLNEQLS